MQSYTFLIDDDRYSVPTLRIEILQDDAAALEFGRKLLAESAHHLRIEVSQDGQALAGSPLSRGAE